MAKPMANPHEVFNQSPEYGGFNAYANDPVLGMITASLPEKVRKSLMVQGEWAGHSETIRLGQLANTHTPVLNTHDAKGNRIDRVEFHPSYHALMRRGVGSGLHCSIWDEEASEKGFRNQARAARFYLEAGVECGHLCPLTMTNASVAALMGSQDLLGEWLPKILSRTYDSANKAPAQKKGITLGMGMTEKQGGSDITAATTRAEPLSDGIWKLNGHKWFMSAPMSDAFLVLAQMKDGLGCFLVPRYLPDGSLNGLRFQRLKDKLGNRSNASSEVELVDCLGSLVGEPGRGIASIMEMVTLTRLDCAVASAGLMRASLAEAVHHCRHRSAFGNKLVDQPIMERVIADLALDSVAASALSFRLAASFDRAAANPNEAAYARLMTPVVKYWTCKTAPSLIYEAMECLGGNGYVESCNLPRHYREAPVNAIWEGSGNIMCLDVLRVVTKSREILEAVLSGLERDLASPNAAKAIDVIRSAAQMVERDPGAARILTEQLAFTAAAAELTRLGAGESANAFMETRLGGLWRSTYGMLDNRHNARAIIDKDFPATS